MAKVSSRVIALVSVFAALYAAGSFLPGFPMIGMPDASISIVRAVEPIYGLVLGPVLGPAAAFLGALIGRTLTGGGSGIYFTPLAPVAAFVAACLSRRRVAGVPGWALGCGASAVIVVLWYATETGRAIPFYAVPHIVALGLAVGFGGRLAEYVASSDGRRLVLGVAVISIAATMAGHLLGGLIYIYLISPPPLTLLAILPVAIVERTVITAISTAIGVPLVLAVRRYFPELRDL